jgi:hypothetical protein
MIDGPVAVVDLVQTEANKALIRRHVEDIIAGRLDKLPSYYEGERYIQHNLLLADGLSGSARVCGRLPRRLQG